MRKRILLTLCIFSFIGASLMGQAIVGGAGVVFTDDDPNNIASLNNVSVAEAHVAYDTSAQVVYFFDKDGTAGTDQWIALDINGVVTSVVGANDITVTNVGSVYTVDFTEALTVLAWNATTNILTYTDEAGNDTTLDLSGSTDINGSNSINITGAGTQASPYVVELAGAHTGGNANMVPVTDGAGNLTWTAMISSAAFTATGELQLTFSDATTVLVNMESIPTVSNKTELDAAAAAVNATSGGVARADNVNTFGMPANADYGVLFFISN